MSHNPDWFIRLQDAASRRGLKLPVIDLDDPDQDLFVWTDHHITAARLLTSEELAIWNHISRLKHQACENDLNKCDEIGLLDETSLHSAIQELDASTQGLQARSNVLRKQQSIASGVHSVHQHLPRHDGFANKNATISIQAERQNIIILNNEIESKLQLDLSSMHKDLEKRIAIISSTVKEKLKSDNRMFESVELAVSPSAAADSSITDEEAQKFQAMLDLLRQILVQCLTTRLDRVYLQALGSHSMTRHVDNFKQDDLDQTEQALDSLYAEIDAIATMTVNQEYGSRIKQIEGNLDRLAEYKARHQATMMIDTTVSLALTADRLSKYFELLQGQRVLHNEVFRRFSQCLNSSLNDIFSGDIGTPIEKKQRRAALMTRLRFLDSGDARDSSTCQPRTNLTTALDEEARLSIDKVVKASGELVNMSAGRLGNLCANHLRENSDIRQENENLDHRLSAVTARLHALSGTQDSHVTIAQQVIERLQRA